MCVDLTYARQSRTRARSGAKGFVVLLIVDVILFVTFGYTWYVKWIGYVALFFLFIAVVEFLNAHRLGRTEEVQAPDDVGDHDFRFESTPDGDWYRRTLQLGTDQVHVQISPFAFPAALLYALKLVRQPDEIVAKFSAFKAMERGRFPGFEPAIDQLQLDTIDFVSRDYPRRAEVSFDARTGGEPWTCTWDDGEFRNLALES